MVREKRLPRGRPRPTPPVYVVRDDRFREFVAEQAKFGLNPPDTPQRILSRDAADERLHVASNPRPAISAPPATSIVSRGETPAGASRRPYQAAR